MWPANGVSLVCVLCAVTAIGSSAQGCWPRPYVDADGVGNLVRRSPPARCPDADLNHLCSEQEKLTL